MHLLGVALEHQVLLTLVQSALLQRPEVKNSVFPLQQLAEDPCNTRHRHSQSGVCVCVSVCVSVYVCVGSFIHL